MINIYPANRLENLVILLDKVMQTGSNKNILSEEVILVQSKGMQHWLNLKLAESRGISMNLTFSLPMQFFWNQIRHILGKDKVPEHSTYTREVLSWRIDDILASDDIIQHPQCQEPRRYWLGNNTDSQQGNADKRYQLSCQLADLFEQYQIFRPDWILGWEANVQDGAHMGHWQAIIWQKLVAQEPLHPVQLLKLAITEITENNVHLPERISLFGINTLPPLWLELLSELGKHTQVHFFHLNPCVEYWGDLKTDKALAREQFYRWLKSRDMPELDSNTEDTTNPLLANLGGQGKEFLYLLQEHTSIEIPVFESPLSLEHEEKSSQTVLKKIQNDILTLQDARNTPETLVDDSLFIASAHSALREVQALHDWLLHQFNDDNTLTPKDILVMCPNVENYAPYVEAVFAHGWSDWSERIPPLPCSIADRTLKDSEPLVQAFIELLELPDSRFQVSQILAWLRLPAIQKKFSFNEDELVLMERWFNHAAIHWGIDAKHKQQILSIDETNNKFSWEQGLSRLLLGFALGDQEHIYQSQLLLPDVEGDEAVLLGRCIELVEQLKFYARGLNARRRPEHWRQFLHQAKDDLFSVLPEDNNARQIIEQAIDDLGEYTTQADYDHRIPLTVVKDFLLSHFNQPEPGRQFMAGQVTFCSMVPMRSVPFRIIAVLGLNDGEFPRQRQPMGFDLMAMDVPRKGDRSRRGDDRYLFLEALISCREKLYLSYQGHDIKTNNRREPSLVLHELTTYLEKAYGWQLSSSDAQQLCQIPMQAFSKDNYQTSDSQRTLSSFSSQWLKLVEPGDSRNNLISLPELDLSAEPAPVDAKIHINAEELVRFFDNPSRGFAQTRLNLFFDAYEDLTPEDSEPFVSNNLDRYVIQNSIITTLLEEKGEPDSVTEQMERFRLSGHLPDNPNTESSLNEWQDQAIDFAEQVSELVGGQKIKTRTIVLSINGFDIEAELPCLDERLFFWRMAEPKGKDDIRLWLYHLISQIDDSTSIKETQGIFRGKKDTFLKLTFGPVSSPEEHLIRLLNAWKKGMTRPLLLNASLGQSHCSGKQQDKPMTEKDFYNHWIGDRYRPGLGSDPYVNWFWSETVPQWQGELQTQVESVYDGLYEHRQEALIK